MTPTSVKKARTVGPASMVLFTLSAVALPANLAIVAVFYWAASHQLDRPSSATAWAVVAAAVVLFAMGGMVWSLRQGRTGLGLALAVIQLLPTLVLGANLAFVALR